ncbi:ROK family protein [Thermanaerothrix sp. 4228-RoL]|jgi:polyphosphate glucokinase|uniref:ROK family protein n=1 Tax=Thermanaerothrix solaris TaxID=3058434 RepID=A0ABU3NKC1_9CHLR|nr:ROK family protein [Thermanaerothrix sp. 4228-RoL]MDT8897293.1 ROK family protein [Thermanaerothrix sp. 4228-RoL]
MKTAMGIDIGGSGIKGAIVDIESGKLISERVRLPTPENSKPDAVAKVVNDLVRALGWDGVIGCGFPAVVHHGVALTAANVHKDWIGTDVNRLISEATGCPTFTLNDADAAGIAEMRFGVGRENARGVVIMLTLGTGIGSAIFTDGHLVPNTEFGHLKIRGKDAEWRASDAARKRKKLTWKKYAKRLQEYLNEMENLFWPDLFIIGGGLSKQAEKFLPLLSLRTRIVPAQLQNLAGIIGAAIYAGEAA